MALHIVQLTAENIKKIKAVHITPKGRVVWVEEVDSTGKVGVVIEDGEVKADHQEESPKAQQQELV